MSRIEFKNGSIIDTIESNDNIRSERGNKQLESAWNFIDDYYNSLPLQVRIKTKITWVIDDFWGFFIRLYYKIIIKILYNNKEEK